MINGFRAMTELNLSLRRFRGAVIYSLFLHSKEPKGDRRPFRNSFVGYLKTTLNFWVFENIIKIYLEYFPCNRCPSWKDELPEGYHAEKEAFHPLTLDMNRLN